MKTTSKQRPRPFPLQVVSYGNSYYIERVGRLEAILARKPQTVQINLIGVGEIPADMALLIRSTLMTRSAATQLITNARSSLQGGTTLVWLLGDRRLIRDDARIFFRPTALSEEEATECQAAGKEEPPFRDSFSQVDAEELDYVRVLELINEFLPVSELAGRRIEAATLRQFGLVDNEKADDFLAAVFAKKSAPNKDRPGKSTAKPPNTGTKEAKARPLRK